MSFTGKKYIFMEYIFMDLDTEQLPIQQQK